MLSLRLSSCLGQFETKIDRLYFIAVVARQDELCLSDDYYTPALVKGIRLSFGVYSRIAFTASYTAPATRQTRF